MRDAASDASRCHGNVIEVTPRLVLSCLLLTMLNTLLLPISDPAHSASAMSLPTTDKVSGESDTRLCTRCKRRQVSVSAPWRCCDGCRDGSRKSKALKKALDGAAKKAANHDASGTSGGKRKAEGDPVEDTRVSMKRLKQMAAGTDEKHKTAIKGKLACLTCFSDWQQR